MTTQSKLGAQWHAEGAEAETILQLARNAPVPPVQDERAAEQRFLTAVREHTASSDASRRARLPRVLWQYGVAAIVLLALGAGALRFGTRSRDDALSYRVKSSEVVSQFIRTEHDPVELDFSDGTIVTVDSRSSARVAETTRRGARFLLESGRMDFNVVPHPDRGRWVVEAGPFQVHVTGTVFSVQWSGAEGLLQVEVTRGHVVVEGAGQRRELGPGDSFHHREPRAQDADAPLHDVVPGEQANLDQQLAPAVDGDGTPPDTAKPTSSVGSPRVKEADWRDLVAAGKFDRVIDAANQRGIQTCLEDCSQPDLRALADAARLGGKPSLAQQALTAQRSRFAGSADATAAAFLLGRLAEDRGDSRAVAWYDTYLAEAPMGRFAGDALGRKMMLVAKSDQRRAVPLAREYRSRFPAGPYAAHAKTLLDGLGDD